VNAVGPGSGLPFLLETSGTDLPMQLIDRLSEHPGLVGIEEPGLDLDRFDILVQRYGAQIPIIAGSEDVLGFTLLLGASGFMTASPNFAPAFMQALWSAAASIDAVTTVDFYRRLRRYRRLFEAELRAGRPLFVSYTKTALDLLGHSVGPPRPPLRRLSDGERRVMGITLRDALGLHVPDAGHLSE
jgi:dihydrodipicolinate synthase/N-acetylneuraminate lyase